MLQSVSLILAAWGGLGLILVGLGSLFRRACLSPAEGADGLLLSFWIGWVCLLFALQIWHLFLPVDVRALTAVAACGALGLALNARRTWAARARAARTHWIALVALGVIAAWLANRALVGPRNGDSGLYHVPTVCWLAEHPIVPGLGNLHSRLAFNQSYFLYVALLDVGPFSHRSGHIANGLLVLALFAMALLGASNVLRRGHPWAPHDLFQSLFLPAAVALAFNLNLTSPSPDVAVFVLGVVLSSGLLAFLERPAPRSPPALDLVSIALLAAGGITVKLSFAALGVTVPLVAAARGLRGRQAGVPGSAHTALALAAVVALGIAPWMVRGVLLSGYPVYPSVVAGFPVDWRVPPDAVAAEAEFIRVWPASPLQAVRDLGWLYVFLRSVGWTEPELVIPVSIALAAAVALLPAFWLCRRRTGEARVPAAILLPTAASLAFWFLTAPRPRFAGAGLWLLATQLVLLVVDRASSRERRLGPLTACAASLAGACALLFGNQPFLSGLSTFDAHAAPQWTEMRLATGLTVNVPAYHLCWDAPLPCTPFPQHALRLRREGDLESGFSLDPSIHEQVDESLVDPAVRLR